MIQPFWSNVPPAPIGANLWSPPSGKSHVVVLGPWAGLYVHWTGSRSVPCLGDQCPKARHIRPCKWCGYLPIALPIYGKDQPNIVTGWKAAVLAVNNDQAAQFISLMDAFPHVGLMIHREKAARVWTVEDVSRIDPVRGLPTCPSVIAVVHRLFGLVPWDDVKSVASSNGELPPFSDVQ